MNDKERLRERFMRDPLATRLGGLAATLARISSSARAAEATIAVANLLDEAKYLIEWTAAETDVEKGAELVQIQVEISLWQRAWDFASRNQTARALLSAQAKKWSDRALEMSGLL